MKDQEGFDDLSKYAERLSEERRRKHPHQGKFSRLIGVNQGRQSLYEQGKRELKAPYLETIAGTGLDVYYIITGRRSPGVLDPKASELLDAYFSLPEELRAALVTYASAMRAYFEQRGEQVASTLHSARQNYQAPE